MIRRGVVESGFRFGVFKALPKNFRKEMNNNHWSMFYSEKLLGASEKEIGDKALDLIDLRVEDLKIQLENIESKLEKFKVSI